MIENVYQIVRYNEGLDHCYQYGTIHRTFEGAEKFIIEVMGYQKIYVKCRDEFKTWYMESKQYIPEKVYSLGDVNYEPHAYIEKHRLMD